MIRHTVVFRLKHPAGSEAERVFLTAAQEQLSSTLAFKRSSASDR